MAVVIPYGDAQAHGSIAKSITFRRHKGKVVLQKKPHMRGVRTPAQITQQERFSDGWVAFHALDLWTLEYLQEKAILMSSSASIIFLSQYLTDAIPSTVKNNFVKEITDLDNPELVGTAADDILFEYLARIDAPPGDTVLADIEDNANIFNAGSVASPYDRLVIKLTRDDVPAIVVPFDYPLLLWYNNFSDDPFLNLVRLPEITMPPPCSDTPRTDCGYADLSEIFAPALPGAGFVTQYLETLGTLAPAWFEIGSRSCSPGIIYTYPGTDPLCTGIRIRFVNNGPTPYNSPDDWQTEFWWARTGDPTFQVDLFFPAFTLNPTEEISFYIATDNSMYFDAAMTQLAKHCGTKSVELFVAWDFSVYWDQAMTSLANSPYFQP